MDKLDNRRSLFGTIPPGVWNKAWEGLHDEDETHRAACLYFWTGVAAAAENNDKNLEDKLFLNYLAFMIVYGEEKFNAV